MQSEIPTREALKEKCRHIVDRLFNGESDYWGVSFQDERILDTYNRFFSAAAECKLNVSDIYFLRQIADQTEVEMTEADNVSLLNSLTQLLVSDSSPEVVKNLSPELVATVVSVFTGSGMNEVDFVSLCLNSTTDWDRKIRDMTSGLPDYLATFAKAIYGQRHHFIQFWGMLVENTSLDERAQLIRWYRGTAFELTGRALETPNWIA